MKILVEVLPEQWRKVLYVGYALVGLVLGTWQVVAQPEWLANAFAAYSFVGVSLGLVAGANTGAPEGGLDYEFIDRYGDIGDTYEGLQVDDTEGVAHLG